MKLQTFNSSLNAFADILEDFVKLPSSSPLNRTLSIKAKKVLVNVEEVLEELQPIECPSCGDAKAESRPNRILCITCFESGEKVSETLPFTL